jgi:alpha-D-ribose 1-methylphosphonate 5-triphosphate synthase subunit PhnG
MAIKTTLEQLEEVQAAITAVMSGQSYTIGDRTVTRANLRELSQREEVLLARYRRETGKSGLSVNIGIPRRDY